MLFTEDQYVGMVVMTENSAPVVRCNRRPKTVSRSKSCIVGKPLSNYQGVPCVNEGKRENLLAAEERRMASLQIQKKVVKGLW